MNGKYEVESKPHGHGDVHMLMHSSGTAKKWAEEERNGSPSSRTRMAWHSLL